MEWYFRNDQPIYTQLTQQITLAILSGSIPSGGRFVTEDLSVIQSAKEKLARGRTREYLSSMAQLGYSRQQVKALLDTWEEE